MTTRWLDANRFVRDTVQEWLPITLLCAFCAGAAGQMAGPAEDRLHSSMPPLPATPADYQNMWDPFALRGPTGEPVAVKAESDSQLRVMGSFDLLPWNGRQLVRDAAENWLMLIAQDGKRILLAGASGTSGNPYRPRGGDFAALELVGEGGAIFAAGGVVSRASMVMDGSQSLHVIWHREDGLWHTHARLGGGFNALRNQAAWSTPVRLVEGACRAGDILRDAMGAVAVSYAVGGTVYYRPLSGRAEVVAGLGAGMAAMQRPAGKDREPGADVKQDDAFAPALSRPGGKIPQSQRECQDAVMDLAPDGSVYLAFRRDFAVWVARRTQEGKWGSPELVAREYVFHPTIMTVGGRPLVVFQHEGLLRIPLELESDLGKRAGGGSAIGYATLGDDGWRTGVIASAEEIVVRRRGMWEKRGTGRMPAQIEQFGWPVMFRDPQGVVWALWQNTSRRWSYCARWMGAEFGEVMECRGPFNAPRFAINAEKQAPAGAADVGLLFHAAAAGGGDRVLFDRLCVPSLSVEDSREVLFLDSLEVALTAGVEFKLNAMTKPSRVPSLSPVGDNRIVWNPSVTKHGKTYVMNYSSPEGGSDHGKPRYGLAISNDGIRFKMVDKLPDGLPRAEQTSTRPLEFWKGNAANTARPFYPNPGTSDPANKLMRLGFSDENRGTYWVEHSADGKTWRKGPAATAAEALRERGLPGFFDPLDPERPIRTYSRVYTETGRSWGVAWTKDLLQWAGLEHLLDPDDPYGRPPAESKIGNTGKSYTMRGQVFLDSCAGKNEDEIYATSVRRAEDLYFCFYWPGRPGRPLADVGLAVSRDGFNFTRVKNGERVLPLGPPGAWDSGYIFQMSPLLDGEQVRVFYRGTAGAREGTDSFDHNLTEIGVATIRVNGWTYYTPSPNRLRGSVTTIPIQSPAGSKRGLAVNFELGFDPNGALAVEVLDAATWQPLKGFAGTDCQGMTAGGLAVPILWRGGEVLPAGCSLRLRFHLTAPGTRLYSFGFRAL